MHHDITIISPLEPDKIDPRLKFILDLPPRFRRFIGIAEVLAIIDLILPGLTGILPWLTPLAAADLVIIMLSAIVFHVRHGENQVLIFNGIILVLAGFVAFACWLILV